MTQVSNIRINHIHTQINNCSSSLTATSLLRLLRSDFACPNSQKTIKPAISMNGHPNNSADLALTAASVSDQDGCSPNPSLLLPSVNIHTSQQNTGTQNTQPGYKYSTTHHVDSTLVLTSDDVHMEEKGTTDLTQQSANEDKTTCHNELPAATDQAKKNQYGLEAPSPLLNPPPI